ncbi:WD-40 repeat-containing protein [Trametes versicolor FP-101664 SS1]|uniref:WD-40 repeat-containing protein n=1 Tax=Trametes versicolor (strain FP-101664) TaxID=717944 RepID=UPI0004623D37|nr:WD-40 repeat-containing protein [Trametes versicolor FP-101664 SS1]EIW57400.1 WD-40 repeat-containing protein [Trametes versicolor FP-101664 SS1]
MSAPPPPPAPKHLIRSHAAAVSVVHVSDDNERIYSGDAAGTVVITSTRSLRAIASWKAHTDGLLGVQEWEQRVITHGRDNKLHVWSGVREPPRAVGGSAALPGLQTPELCYSLDVNALNFCRFSLLPLPADARTDERQALLAVPNLVESAYADVWTLPGKQRLHAAIGKAGQAPSPADVRNPIGIIMCMHLSSVPHPHAAGGARLRLLCGYENGSVTMRGYVREDREVSVEGVGWESLWSVRLHVESVMAMSVSMDGSFALSVSADHLIGRYNFAEAESAENVQQACTAFKTKHPGNGSVAIKDDGRICAVGGWDGRVRLYSTKSFKPLGTLAYHKKNCQSIAFARAQPAPALNAGGEESDDEMTEQEKTDRTRWLVSGGRDSRVAIWSLINFAKT